MESALQKRLSAMKKKPLAMQSRLKQNTSVVIRKRKLPGLWFGERTCWGLGKKLPKKIFKKVLTTTRECVIINLTKRKWRIKLWNLL
jgi:hypothetical protein